MRHQLLMTNRSCTNHQWIKKHFSLELGYFRDRYCLTFRQLLLGNGYLDVSYYFFWKVFTRICYVIINVFHGAQNLFAFMFRIGFKIRSSALLTPTRCWELSVGKYFGSSLSNLLIFYCTSFKDPSSASISKQWLFQFTSDRTVKLRSVVVYSFSGRTSLRSRFMLLN